MKFCDECQVKVETSGTKCVLCGTELRIQRPDDFAPLYPPMNSGGKPKSSFTPLAKIFIFLSLVAGGICILINILLWQGFAWSLIVVGGITIGWVLIGIPLTENMNLNLMLIFQMICVQIFIVLVDINLGFQGWSLDYVYPLLFIAIAVAVAVFTIIHRMAWRDFLFTVVIMAIYGLSPLIFIAVGLINVLWPSYAAVLVSIFLSFGIAIFARDKFKNEFNKRMKF